MGKEVGILRFVRAVAVAGAVVVLSGCVGGGGEPSPSPITVASASVEAPSPSPSLTHEEQMLALIPDAAKGDDLLAAEAMAKFFISLHPGLYQGDDPALWEFLCLPESVFCSTSVEASRTSLEEGEIQVGGEIVFPEQLPEMVLDVNADVPTAYIGLEVLQESLSIVTPEGVQLAEKVEVTFSVAFRLKYVDELWRVSGIELERDGPQ